MHILLSIGSNRGDRTAFLSKALEALTNSDVIELGRVSHCYETEPAGVTGQPAFLNLAAEIETVLEPLELLKAIKAIEKKLGRVPTERWGPREIDIDIILWADRVMRSEVLTLPHKEFRNRAFVLVPICEIAPNAVDPETGQTVAELASSPQLDGAIISKKQMLLT